MRDTEQVLCLACHNPVPQKHGKRARLYCNDVCKTTYHRKLAREAIHAALLEGYLPETQQVLEAVQGHSMELAQRVASAINDESAARTAGLEGQVCQLQQRLDGDNLYRMDTKERTLQAWLKKQATYPQGSFQSRLIADKAVPQKASKATYIQTLKKLGYSQEERETFRDVWIAMMRLS